MSTTPTFHFSESVVIVIVIYLSGAALSPLFSPLAAQHSFPSRSYPKQTIWSFGMVHYIPAEHREYYINIWDSSRMKCRNITDLIDTRHTRKNGITRWSDKLTIQSFIEKINSSIFFCDTWYYFCSIAWQFLVSILYDHFYQ
jgi:hypothetical protein